MEENHKNSLTITGGRVICETEVIESGTVTVRDGRINHIGHEGSARTAGGRIIDANGFYVSPGFIDLHVHGAAGENFLDAEEEAVNKAIAAHARYGTTGLLATLETASLKSMETGLVCLSNLIAGGRCDGLLGIHLEGPYLNRVRCGAQSADEIRKPDRSELLNLLDLSGDSLRIVTLAPEVEGGIELVKLVEQRGGIPAIGHSNASYEEAEKSFASGVRYVVHLFNAMSGLHHRHPGLAAAALMKRNLPVELIVDGIHVAPRMILLTLELKGWDDIILVTDCIEALDADSAEFREGRSKVTVRNGVPQFEDGVLCGTILTMNRAVRNLREYTAASIIDVVKPATINPARVLGLEDRKGVIAVGKDADLVIFDDNIDVKATIVGGKIVHNTL